MQRIMGRVKVSDELWATLEWALRRHLERCHQDARLAREGNQKPAALARWDADYERAVEAYKIIIGRDPTNGAPTWSKRRLGCRLSRQDNW